MMVRVTEALLEAFLTFDLLFLDDTSVISRQVRRCSLGLW